MLEIILMEPENPGNVGAVARVMKNFGFSHLTLIEPKCSPHNIDALWRATHGRDILHKAKIVERSYLRKAPLLIATTAKLGSDYNVNRTPITPKQLAQRLKMSQKAALLFGRESSGLTNEELKSADIVVHIPAAQGFPTLNVAQAASIVLYELFQARDAKHSQSHFAPVSKKELSIIYSLTDKIIGILPFSSPQKRLTQKRIWRRLFARAALTRREAFAVLGLLKKMLKQR